MSNTGKDGDAGRSKSSSLRMLNHILTHDKDDSRKASAGTKPVDKNKRISDNSKLNSSIEKSKTRAGSETANMSSSKLGFGKAGGKNTGSPMQSKGSTQISQLKTILVGYKGQIQEKKASDSGTGSTPINNSSSKGRQGVNGTSSSVSKLNTSLERSRIGQKSVDIKTKLLKAAGEKPSINLNNSRTSAKRENLNTSTSATNDPLNNTQGGSSKIGKNGTVKPKTSLVSTLGSKLLTSKSTTKMSGGSSSKFGRTHETKTEDDNQKENSQLGDSTKDNSRKKPSTSSSSSKLGNKSGITGSLSYDKSKIASNVNRSRTEENADYYSSKDRPVEASLDEGSQVIAKDFKKKPIDSKQSKLSSLVTQVKPGHMFNESSTKQRDLDKEIQNIHTPRGDESPRITVKEAHLIPHIDTKEAWKCYYVKNLIDHLKNEDDSVTMVKIYKEHFYQTVQSILFLQNVEKIDENLLVEKKVYLPPNILSSLS
jgi:hypothetical protein